MAEWISNALNYLTGAVSGLFSKLIVAVLIFLIGFIIGNFVGKLTQKLLHELEIDSILKKNAKLRISFEKTASKFVAYFIYFIAIIAGLNQLGLTTTILNMISAAVLIIIVLSIILGIKDFIPNSLAGIHIQRKKLIREGDTILFMGTEGTVTQIELTETKLKTKSGDTIFVPNSILIREKLVRKKR